MPELIPQISEGQEARSLNPKTLNHLATHFRELGKMDPSSLDITQLAIALKNHILPAIHEHSKAQDILDAIKALVTDPITRPTQVAVEIKNILEPKESFLNENSSLEKVKIIQEKVDHALQHPPSFKVLFITIKPTHEDSTILYKKIYALCSGKEWIPKQNLEQDSNKNNSPT